MLVVARLGDRDPGSHIDRSNLWCSLITSVDITAGGGLSHWNGVKGRALCSTIAIR